jgi:uncharacterized protein (DUF2141 family)
VSRGVRLLWLAPCLAAMLCAGGAAAASGNAPECGDEGPPVTVDVGSLRSTDGNLTVTIYGDRASDFLAPGRKLARKRVPITGETTSVCINVPEPGTYAIAAYHDEDDDHDFDRTMIGLPAEGYALSNDAAAIAGLPSFEAVRFDVPSDGKRLSIRMRY